MASFDVTRHRQSKLAAKLSKRIGQGGPMRIFLDEVQPFTRSVRAFLAVSRAIEAHVDNRLFEVAVAETL